jgi:hypothetical protein
MEHMNPTEQTIAAEEELCEELRVFCLDNGLPFISAGDLVHQVTKPEHTAWLRNFQGRWEAAADCA